MTYTMTEDDEVQVILVYYPEYEKPSDSSNWFVRDDYNWLKYVMENAVQKVEDAVTEL